MLKLSRDIVGVEFFMTKRILVGCLPLWKKKRERNGEGKKNEKHPFYIHFTYRLINKKRKKRIGRLQKILG
jgi:hypothetical protein